MRKNSRNKGFTLIELAIVMVIIGLLVGAVLKGQAMIEDARIKRVINDINGISAAYFTYMDRYSAIPGDDGNALARWGIANGNSDGQIAGTEATGTGESGVAWQAMRYAGLLSGDPTTTGVASLLRHPFGDVYGIGDLTFANGIGLRNRVLVNDLPAEIAEIIDLRLDDGVWNTGTVQALAAYGPGTLADLSYAL